MIDLATEGRQSEDDVLFADGTFFVESPSMVDCLDGNRDSRSSVVQNSVKCITLPQTKRSKVALASLPPGETDLDDGLIECLKNPSSRLSKGNIEDFNSSDDSILSMNISQCGDK